MTTDSALHCGDDRRRHAVRAADLNGLDYLEVSDDQRTLTVYFLGKAPDGLTERNVRVTGGRRIRDVRVAELSIHHRDDPDLDDYAEITVDKAGDFSPYTLCLVDVDEQGRQLDRPPADFDPRYTCLDFSFKAGCPSDLDCKPVDTCPPEEHEAPEINYLAKDYESFRRLMLDRLALIMPDWQERHVPDLGIALVELLAYTGDYLSYYQDAVATEAYLNTARRRISVRRHARLVDYQMHDGCNARTWVHLHTDTDLTLDPAEVAFITRLDPAFRIEDTVLAADDLRTVPHDAYETFEPLLKRDPIQLYTAHSEIQLYTWGDAECCLARGATRATLKDEWGADEQPASDTPEQAAQQAPKEGSAERERRLQLREGDVLIFEEVIGPKTGNPADADPRHRHAVRLTRVEPDVDPLCEQPVVEIEWAEADALPFPLCISAVGPAPACELLENISVARGNVVLVDHGRRIDDEDLGRVPVETTAVECGSACHPAVVQTVPGTFRPRLHAGPSVFSVPPSPNGPASELLRQDPRQAVPWISLYSIPATPDGSAALFEPDDLDDPTDLIAALRDEQTAAAQHLLGRLSSETRRLLAQEDAEAPSDALRRAVSADLEQLVQGWTAVRDLLHSDADDRHVVAEIDNDGRANLRFGDGDLGQRPEAGSRFVATYRVGGGPVGNVGAEALAHLVLRTTTLSGVTLTVRNPLPARGGTAPETLADVKLFAPHAFRGELQRAITPEDYAEIVVRDFEERVQRAAATLRWTGSWYEVLVAIDPSGGVEPEQSLLDEISLHLHRYRRIGHDLAVRPAQYVPLLVELDVCVRASYLRGHVKAALLDRFSNRALAGGERGVFHPDNLTFGDGVYLSALVAAAQAVPGVESVAVTKLERLFEGPNGELEAGVLPLGPLEIARLDNDPSFPEHGHFRLTVRGGR